MPITSNIDSLEKLERIGGVLCDTTLTPRFSNPDCKCPTYPGNLGPCGEHLEGSNGRCVYCDHELSCHPKAVSPEKDLQLA